MLEIVIGLYLAGLHLFAGAVLWRRLKRHIPPRVAGRNVCLGDSLMAGFPARDSINLAKSGSTTGDVLEILPRVQKARSIHLQVGTNDLLYCQQDGLPDRIRAIAAGLPKVPVTWSGIAPSRQLVDRDVTAANDVIRETCTDRGFTFVDTSMLTGPESHAPDGIHLSALGYERWRNALYSVSR